MQITRMGGKQMNWVRFFAFPALLIALSQGAATQEAAPLLVPDGVIALPHTAGRIDHMAIDLTRNRLFVAELGNGTVDVVDLISHKVIHRITGLKEPQGIGYEPKSDVIAVADGGDGTLRFFSGLDFRSRGALKLGDDADNVRIDPQSGYVLVGYGEGALAVVDPSSMRKVEQISLPAHPESFQLFRGDAFINVPDAGNIVLADLANAKILDVWKPARLSSNYPMTLDGRGHVAVVFRGQSKLALLDRVSGSVIATTDTCGDADDLYFDARRNHFYVSCGSGAVEVMSDDPLHLLARIRTALGARTSLFVPELGHLFVAARAPLLGSTASILVYRTN